MKNKILLTTLFALLTGCATADIPVKHIERVISQCNKNDGLKSAIINYGGMFITTITCNDGARFIIEDTK